MKYECSGCGDSGEFTDGISDSDLWNFGGFWVWEKVNGVPTVVTCKDCTGFFRLYNSNPEASNTIVKNRLTSVLKFDNFVFHGCLKEENIIQYD